MVEKELHALIKQIQIRGCEEQTMEVKSAHYGCPEKLYDTISVFPIKITAVLFFLA